MNRKQILLLSSLIIGLLLFWLVPTINRNQNIDQVQERTELDDKPRITAAAVTRIIEESPISDQQLIEYANIEAFNSDWSTASQVEIIYPPNFTTKQPSPIPYRFTAVVTNDSQLNNQQASAQFDVFVDPVAPVLYYKRDRGVVKLGSDLDDLSQLIDTFGISSKELKFGDTKLSYRFTTTNQVSSTIVGSYPIEFTAVDDDGQSTSVTLELVVADDSGYVNSQIPSIELVPTYAVSEGTKLTDAELYAAFSPIVSDNSLDPITAKMKRPNINWNTIGEYQITFIATDLLGNTVSRAGKLVITDKLPEFTWDNQKVVVESGLQEVDYISLFGIKAGEIKVGDLTSKIEVISPEITTSGEYQVGFKVRDNEGNPQTIWLDLVVI